MSNSTDKNGSDTNAWDFLEDNFIWIFLIITAVVSMWLVPFNQTRQSKDCVEKTEQSADGSVEITKTNC